MVMSATDDMHAKMKLATSEEIWSPGGPVEDWTTDYDIRDDDYIENPVPIWAEMRAKCPIAHTDRLGGSWNPTKFDDLRALAKMTSELSSRQVLVMPPAPNAPEMSRYEQMIAAAPITADPPIHTWTRRMLLPAFAPRAVEAHRQFTEDLCHSLIDGFIEAGECDAAVDYSQQIPPRVIAHLIGVDPGMADQFVDWVNALLGAGLNDPVMRMKARDEMLTFIGAEVAKRQEDPQEDLLTELLFMELDMPEAQITPQVVVGITNLLIVAGIDTTWSSIGSALWHLGTNPDDRRRLLDEPDIMLFAIEEFLRYYAPVTMARIAETDIEYDDVHINRGDKVLMNFPAACHDPEQFENPDEFIIDRAQEPSHRVRFGYSPVRRLESRPARDERRDQRVAGTHPRVPRERSRADEVGGRSGARSARAARVVPARVRTLTRRHSLAGQGIARSLCGRHQIPHMSGCVAWDAEVVQL